MRIRRLSFKPTVSQIFTFIVACLAVFLIINLAHKAVVCQQKQVEKEAIAAEVADLQSRVDGLRADLADAHRPETVEQSLREDFGLVNENEGMVILQFEETPVASDPLPPSESVGSDSAPPYWVEWIKAFLQP